METQVQVGILCALGLCWASVSLAEPSAALDPGAEATAALAALEDRYAHAPDDAALAERLADAYLEMDRADLAVAALGSAGGEALSDPSVGHRLARAYEETGRLGDALSTAELARARCARALGTAEASAATPVPARGCSERVYVSLEMHASALARMRAWGVTDARHDPRAEVAYALSVRAARIVSASR